MPRILIVEDTAVIREPIAQALGVRGFVVSCAENGHDALSQMTNCKPDLILLDLKYACDGWADLPAAFTP